MAPPVPPNQRPTRVQPPWETPTLGGGGALTYIASNTISAPLATVVATLLDTRAYDEWNLFCPRVTINNQPASPAPLPPCLAASASAIAELPTTLRAGTDMTLHVQLGPNGWRTTSPLRVSVLEQFERDGRAGVRVAWRTVGWMPRFLLNAERVQEVVEVHDGVVEYSSYETLYGALSSTVRVTSGTAMEWGFGAWMDGLKEHAEKLAARGGTD